MIGIPLFPGFASKLYIASAALETRFAVWVVPAVVVAGTVLGAMYYIPAIACIFGKSAEQVPEIPEYGTWSCRAALLAFMVLTLFLGLFSQQILRVIELGLAVFG